MTLSDELEGLRDQFRRAILNGAEAAVRPPQPSRTQAAAEAEQDIVDLLRDRPGLKSAEIAKATKARTSTTGERLKRLTAKGLIGREDAGAGWRAA